VDGRVPGNAAATSVIISSVFIFSFRCFSTTAFSHINASLVFLSGQDLQVAAVQAAAVYGVELWWDETKNHSRITDLQRQVNRKSRSITGMLRTTPIGPLVNEAGLRSADPLLANRQRRYATCAFD
jgi:hypothetical protein